MSRTYHHLSPEDRAVIMIERQNGSSLRSTPRRLGRSPSTLSRELQRAGPGAYGATLATQGCRERRSARPRGALKQDMVAALRRAKPAAEDGHLVLRSACTVAARKQ
ncbi:helix-turn-helix domain-containing protein [Luteimonas sp. A537]